MTMHAGQNTEGENMMSQIMFLQSERIQELEADLKTQLMKFMTWHSGDEHSQLPEGLEEIIDIYLSTDKLPLTPRNNP